MMNYVGDNLKLNSFNYLQPSGKSLEIVPFTFAFRYTWPLISKIIQIVNTSTLYKEQAISFD
jgi:hypothetical protein